MIFNKNISSLKKDLDLSDEILRILANRGLTTKTQIDEFLNPELSGLHDPFLMQDMDIAVDIVLDSIEKDEHIHIVGDYDQDGNSATVTLIKGLKVLHDKITYAIPDRIEDGYGINPGMVDTAIKNGVDLIITCDNGISAHEAVSYAKEKGIKVIITDHHQVKLDENEQQTLPDADAVINPHRHDCNYPFKELCGAGVAYKLICGIYEAVSIPVEESYELLQFVAMGTVCDVVDLLGENRIIVVEGLKRINNTSNFGLLALIEQNSWNKEVDVYALGFVLGPCINASGRLSTARLGVELFLEEDEELVVNYAMELVRLNNERKQLTQDTFDSVIDEIEVKNLHRNDIIVVYSSKAHESIVGIVAGRVKDKYHRPTIVFAESKDSGIIKGSGRSIETYDMHAKLTEAKHLLKSFGGHKMAAGVSLELNNLSKLEEFLNENSLLTKKELQREITIDVAFPSDKVNEDFIEELSILEPFGKGNSKPVFADKNLELLNYQILGQNKNVIKLNIAKSGKVIECIGFGDVMSIEQYLHNRFGAENLNGYNINRKPNYIDLVYFPKINEFRGNITVQLQIIDIR